MRPAPDLAAAVVRVWTRAYTAGLHPGLRESRRAEIDSDLWEHARAAQDAAAAPRSIAGQMLARCLLGIAADLTWRSQMVAGPSRLEKGVSMNDRIRRDWWIPAPIVLGILSAFFQLTHLVGGRAGPDQVPGVGAIAIVGSLFVVLPIWALVVRRRHPGWTFVMLLPLVLFSLAPLMWGEITVFQLGSLLGIVTVVGAVMNLAQHFVEEGPDLSPPQAQRVHG
jgi:uncharacterized membrane protein YhaH (DUF805 family)